jgi:hypothetical protein
MAKSISTDRVRLHRLRRRAGKIVVQLSLDKAATTRTLTVHGFLHPWSGDDCAALGRAIEHLVTTLALEDAGEEAST